MVSLSDGVGQRIHHLDLAPRGVLDTHLLGSPFFWGSDQTVGDHREGRCLLDLAFVVPPLWPLDDCLARILRVCVVLAQAQAWDSVDPQISLASFTQLSSVSNRSSQGPGGK